MFNFFKKKESGGQLIGDLDLMSRRPTYIRYKGKEWKVEDFTARDYARLCAILKEIEDATKAGKIEPIDPLYCEIINLAIPSMWSFTVKRMALVDINAMVIWILKHYGIDLDEKKKIDPPVKKKKLNS